jgi:hypothetical protein
LIQIEAICFPGHGTKIPNYNTQITNNIKIANSNTGASACAARDQNISIAYWMFHRHFCFEF